MRGIRLLREHELAFGVLCVLTSQSIDRPDELFDFFVEEGLSDIAFNVEEIEGPHLRSSLLDSATGPAQSRPRYRAFMERIAELNRLQGRPLAIREFARQAQNISARRADPSFVPAVAEQRAGAILTMTRDGLLYTWSPELASGLPGSPDRLALGRIDERTSLDELLDGPQVRRIQDEIERGVEMCRSRCAYFGVCGGGSPGNKLYERGTFAATETMKCALQVQELTEAILASSRRKSRLQYT